MRLYSFVNFYLSPLQHGLQTAHCVSELFTKYYIKSSAEQKVLSEWAEDHKTIIILNGGNSQGLRETFAIFEKFGTECRLPFVKFHEDTQSLDNALTAVSIVLPEPLYSAKEDEPGVFTHLDDRFNFTRLRPAETFLVQHIRRFRLA